MSEAYLSLLWKWVVDSPPGEWAVRQFQGVLIYAMKHGPVPRHIAFEMDGNRRYARHRRMETLEGHGQGFLALGRALEICLNLGVKVVSVYAFAVDNFSRPKYEVEGLMEMFKVKMEELTNTGELLDRYSVRVRVLGERHLIRKDVLVFVDRAVERTKHNTEATLNICFPYGSREEMTAAVRATVEEYLKPPNPRSTPFSQHRISRRLQWRQVDGKRPLSTIRDESPTASLLSDVDDGLSTSTTLPPDSPSHRPHAGYRADSSTPEYPAVLPNPETITTETLDRHMYTAEDPPLDIFIRTSGVDRLSNFLCWQCHQETHIFFLRNYWPDFDFWHLFPVLLEWQWRRKHQLGNKPASRKKKRRSLDKSMAVPMPL